MRDHSQHHPSPNGLFSLPCCEWRQRTVATERIFEKFNLRFRTANIDRKSTVTTGASGCNDTTNQAKMTAAPTQAEIIAEAVEAAVKSTLAAQEIAPAKNTLRTQRTKARDSLLLDSWCDLQPRPCKHDL